MSTPVNIKKNAFGQRNETVAREISSIFAKSTAGQNGPTELGALQALKDEQRSKIAADLAAWLLKGNQIESVPSGATAEYNV
jgi:hypothetical protein